MGERSQIKMQKLIFDSFRELMENNDFSDITITDIADKALVHRNTVYHHFNDKYDLLDKFINYEFKNREFNFRNFKDQPFKFFHDLYYSSIEKVINQQKDDHTFETIAQNSFLKLIINTQNDEHVFWQIGKIAGILLWNDLNENKYDMFRDYQLLDEIYRTEKFPKNNE